eukprot:432736_1
MANKRRQLLHILFIGAICIFFGQMSFIYTGMDSMYIFTDSETSLIIDIDPIAYPKSIKYYYYDNVTYFPSLKYFINCRIRDNFDGWAKNAPEHFFYQQLQFNEDLVQHHRVYDCFSADIYIIPVSLGNAGGGACGNGSGAQTKAILSALTKEIFGTKSKSCWNINKRSQKHHLIMNGGDIGRKYIRHGHLDQWGPFIIGDNANVLHSYCKKRSQATHLFNRRRAIAWDSMRKSKHRESTNLFKHGGYVSPFRKKKSTRTTNHRCCISYGFSSVVSYLLLISNSSSPINATLTTNANTLSADYTFMMNGYHTNTLPSISYANPVPFRDRTYGTFFMGQASEKITYYDDRVRAMKHAKHMRRAMKYNMDNSNIWIQTHSKKMPKHLSYNQCVFNSSDKYTLHEDRSYPCYYNQWGNPMLYVQLLSNSKYNLMFHGGDACSSRFYDAISLDVINIVISDNFKEDCLIGSTITSHSFTALIPWDKMFLHVEMRAFRHDPIGTIKNLISKYNESYYENMLRTVDKYKKYILWDRKDSASALYLMYNAISKCYA